MQPPSFLNYMQINFRQYFYDLIHAKPAGRDAIKRRAPQAFRSGKSIVFKGRRHPARVFCHLQAFPYNCRCCHTPNALSTFSSFLLARFACFAGFAGRLVLCRFAALRTLLALRVLCVLFFAVFHLFTPLFIER